MKGVPFSPLFFLFLRAGVCMYNIHDATVMRARVHGCDFLSFFLSLSLSRRDGLDVVWLFLFPPKSRDAL